MKKILLMAIKESAKIILSIGKSIWRSSLSILYLIVYSFLLFALLNYYGIDFSQIDSFMNLLNFLIDHWGLFWWIFFLSNMYDEWRWRR
ncbi:hypothetical protein LCGC14_0439340 [marine sediment metagenome]|uniref:Uncharacterized protein n=1 Tax=marine sediment metagenome TaxID=412755 RepID=A0A0F9V7V1_9ZZZZ